MLRKNVPEFVARVLIQPFLLVFVFLYVFPTIGQGIGGGSHGSNATTESDFATVLVPGVVAISIMFQGIQAVALQMSTEFGYTREIEDRVQAPCPIWLVAIAKVLSGAVQGMLAAVIVFPIAAVIHAPGVHAHLSVHWWIVLTLIPLASVAMTSLGLLLGTTFEPRNIGLMFGFVVLPLTFLGGTYYQWTKLAPVKVAGIHWLQILVLINPLIYVAEGMRAGLTEASHMPLYVVYPVLIAFCAFFLGAGAAQLQAACVGLTRRRGAWRPRAHEPWPRTRPRGRSPKIRAMPTTPLPRTARPGPARRRPPRRRAGAARGGEAGGERTRRRRAGRRTPSRSARARRRRRSRQSRTSATPARASKPAPASSSRARATIAGSFSSAGSPARRAPPARGSRGPRRPRRRPPSTIARSARRSAGRWARSAARARACAGITFSACPPSSTPT